MKTIAYIILLLLFLAAIAGCTTSNQLTFKATTDAR